MNSASIASQISTTVRSSRNPGRKLAQHALRAATRYLPNWSTRWLSRQFLSPRGRQPALDLSEARQVSVRVRSHGLRVGVWGHGAPVLLVHGWAGSGEQFRTLRQALVSAGFSVVCFDAPAHGANFGRDSNLPEFIASIAAIEERCGPFHAIVGHSLGATASALYERTRAQRDAADACPLVLLAPMPGFNFAMDHFCTSLGLDATTRERLESHLETTLSFERKQFELSTLDLHQQCLLVHDTGDRQVPVSFSRELQQRWPRAELFETRGLGHKRALADAEVMQRIVHFVQQTPKRTQSALDRQLAALDEAWPD